MRVKEGIYITKTPRIEAALSELEQLVHEQYPTATFTNSIELEPLAGFYLNVTVDVDDTDEVHDLIVDRLLDMQVEEELPVHVWIEQTLERREANQREYVAAAKEREHLPATAASE